MRKLPFAFVALLFLGNSFLIAQYSLVDTLGDYNDGDVVPVRLTSTEDVRDHKLYLISRGEDGAANADTLLQHDNVTKEVEVRSEEGEITGEGKGMLEEKEGVWRYYHPEEGIANEANRQITLEDPHAPPLTEEKHLKKIGFWKQGYRIGTWKTYDTAGRLVELQEWNLNYLGGMVFAYHSNGKLKSKGRIGNTYYQDSTWVYYDSLGNLSRKEWYIPEENTTFKNRRYLDSCIAFDEQQRVILQGNQDQLTQYIYWPEGGIKEEYQLSLVRRFSRGKFDTYQERMIWEKPFYRSSKMREGQVTPIGQNRYQIRKHTKYNEEGVVVEIARFDEGGLRYGDQFLIADDGKISVKANVSSGQILVEEMDANGDVVASLKFFEQLGVWKLSRATLTEADGREIIYDPTNPANNLQVKESVSKCTIWTLGWGPEWQN